MLTCGHATATCGRSRCAGGRFQCACQPTVPPTYEHAPLPDWRPPAEDLNKRLQDKIGKVKEDVSNLSEQVGCCVCGWCWCVGGG